MNSLSNLQNNWIDHTNPNPNWFNNDASEVDKNFIDSDPMNIDSYSPNIDSYSPDIDSYSPNIDSNSIQTETIFPLDEDFTSIFAKELPSLAQLMMLTDEEWSKRLFSLFKERIDYYCAVCLTAPSLQGATSFMEKHDLEPGSEVAVIGDIHGNGLRLDLTLKALQKQGFLDAQYQCKPGKNVVFLGDYADRGKDNLKVLELLMAFKLENPLHVFLVRGNHEHVNTVLNHEKLYTENDSKYARYLADEDNVCMLQQFYEMLPAAVYLGQKNYDTQERQYIQFSHGLFHLYTDPNPLLKDPNPHASLSLKEEKSWSTRIELMKNPSYAEWEGSAPKKFKQYMAVYKLEQLTKKFTPKFKNIYWFDVGNQLKVSDKVRKVISPEFVKAYLRVCSTDTHKVKQLFRGHQLGGLWSLGEHKKRKFITTLDPSQMENRHMIMKIKLSQKVRDYKKSALFMPLDTDHQKSLKNILEFAIP